MRAFLVMLVSSFITFTLFVVLSMPISTVFDTIQDAANDTIPDDTSKPGANSTVVRGFFNFFRPIFAIVSVILFAAGIILYVVDSHRREVEQYEWRG